MRYRFTKDSMTPVRRKVRDCNPESNRVEDATKPLAVFSDGTKANILVSTDGTMTHEEHRAMLRGINELHNRAYRRIS